MTAALVEHPVKPRDAGREAPAAGLPEGVGKRRRRVRWSLAGLALLFAAMTLLAIGWGAVSVSPGRVLAVLLSPLGLTLPWEPQLQETAVVWSIRLPRAILAALTGAVLAVAGATLQALFRNPLADPSLIGVSNGAALGAVASIVLGQSLAGLLPVELDRFLLPLAAFAGGLAATAIVYAIAQHGGRGRIGGADGGLDVATLLLAGIAINAIAAAGMGFLVFLADDQQLRDLTFWNLGSLAGATWRSLTPVVPFLLLNLILLPRFTRALDLYLLGETAAQNLGVCVTRLKRRAILLVALGVGASVALTGVIGFIGLVVPHLVRLVIGPRHGALLPASILLGASLMMGADLLARTLVVPAELPVGVLTASIGGPFFIWLLLRGAQGRAM